MERKAAQIVSLYAESAHHNLFRFFVWRIGHAKTFGEKCSRVESVGIAESGGRMLKSVDTVEGIDSEGVELWISTQHIPPLPEHLQAIRFDFKCGFVVAPIAAVGYAHSHAIVHGVEQGSEILAS